MAIKKSEIYSSLWASCDELRGGMDASQYKDYVLVILFIKYISDKYDGQPYSPIKIPEGASFKDQYPELEVEDSAMSEVSPEVVGQLVQKVIYNQPKTKPSAPMIAMGP